jgi:hypothetical protein
VLNVPQETKSVQEVTDISQDCIGIGLLLSRCVRLEEFSARISKRSTRKAALQAECAIGQQNQTESLWVSVQ